MLTKKAQKQFDKLPAHVQAAALDLIKAGLKTVPINKRRSALATARLGMNYRMVVERNSNTIVWIGSHNAYNTYLKRI